METKFIEAVEKYCPDNAQILDIGAREGAQSRKFQEAFPKSTVHTFEANPIWEHFLRGLNYTMAAVTDHTGEIDFYDITKHNRGASSIYQPGKRILPHDPDPEYRKIRVPCTRIDDWAERTDIDAVWMDVQGAELKALNGFGRILSNVSVIVTECETDIVYEDGGTQFPELSKFMHDKGFVLIAYEQDWEKEANLLYVRRDLL